MLSAVTKPDAAHDPSLNYGAAPWRAPALADGDTLLFDEPGRVLPSGFRPGSIVDVDYRAFYIRLVRDSVGAVCLLVRHGAGEERHTLRSQAETFHTGLTALQTNVRYGVLFALYDAIRTAANHAAEKTAYEYRTAFLEGRLKKRRNRANGTAKVWIESATAANAG